MPGWLHSRPAHCRFGPFPSGVLRRHSFHSLLRSLLRITFQHATCRRTRPCPPAPLPSELWPSRASSAVASSDTRPCTGWLHSRPAHCRFEPFPSGILRRLAFHSLLRSPLRFTFRLATCRPTTPCPHAPLPVASWPSRVSFAPRTVS